MMKNWLDYWNQDLTSPLWSAYTEYFIREFTSEFSLASEDILLDIGCGNGQIAASLAKFVRQAYGADTALSCVKRAAARYADVANLAFFHLSPDDYLAVDKLPILPPSYVICVSVVQYYRHLDELRSLISNCKRIAAPGARLILADLLIDYKFLKDIAGIFIGSLKTKTFFRRLREALSGGYGSYSEIRAKNPLLTMTRQELERICALENVKLKFIERDFVGTCFRSSVLLEL